MQRNARSLNGKKISVSASGNPDKEVADRIEKELLKGLER